MYVPACGRALLDLSLNGLTSVIVLRTYLFPKRKYIYGCSSTAQKGNQIVQIQITLTKNTNSDSHLQIQPQSTEGV